MRTEINNEVSKTIYFDMDGTIADLYAVDEWLPKLRSEDSTPYRDAKPMVNMSILARRLNKLSRMGFDIAVVSWTAKNGTPKYNNEVAKAKKEWLKKHLRSVEFSEIVIAEYGIPKSTLVKDKNGILFDDEYNNRIEWKGMARDTNDILDTLKAIELSSESGRVSLN